MTLPNALLRAWQVAPGDMAAALAEIVHHLLNWGDSCASAAYELTDDAGLPCLHWPPDVEDPDQQGYGPQSS